MTRLGRVGALGSLECNWKVGVGIGSGGRHHQPALQIIHPQTDCEGSSMEELVFERRAAAEYDRAFAHVARYFMPFVLGAARIAPGTRVLDIAAGTGLSAEA